MWPLAKISLLIVFIGLMILGCSGKDVFFPKAQLTVESVDTYLYFPGKETPFPQVSISLRNELGISAYLNRISISYMDQKNRSKKVMARGFSSSFDQVISPQTVSIVKLVPIESDFFNQLALLDPVVAQVPPPLSSSTLPVTAQEFPVIGKISMALRDVNGHDVIIDANVLIHFLGDIPIPAPTTTGTSTGTNTNTNTGTSTGTSTGTKVC